ncbi:G kinase-anchoring protein 1 isoform X2 [Leptinotarsa decemlineata]|uniref:G kinase-anchoring protein 1 isoform X2 n=1 Tax=Leptinotarsa decemlineata TaxID=7539 RepID=UPI000C25590E|nr:G kinase-anchoring protein 1-like [Leptinotarsa decemlineata]
MAGISVPSRFSCLKIEDEEFVPVSSKSNKKLDNKQIKKTNITSNNKKSTKQTQSLSTSKKKHKPKTEDKQWEDWKKKDKEFVEGNFEQDLQCAILQSKLDYEHQKKSSESVTTQDKLKKKKNKTMSLDEFLDDGNPSSTKEKGNRRDDSETNFFEKAMNSTKEEIKREKVEEKRRERANNIEEVISLAHCQEKLQKEKELNNKLKKELEESRKEIASVKKRNKTLCNMLSQGEMKDKAAILLELEKLTTVKEELTEEVARLHELLEQERSSTKANSNLVSDSQSSKQKIKKKKN